MASGGHLQDLDQTEFLAQAREYEDAVDSGQYADILAGNYPRRADDKNASISAEAQAAAESYLHAFRSSQDSIARLVRDLGDGVGDLGRWVGEKFRGQG